MSGTKKVYFCDNGIINLFGKVSRTGVPMELERIVGKALKKNPAERYQRIDEMLLDLKSVSEEPKAGKDRVYRNKREKRR